MLWRRSIARTKQVVARNLRATQNAKVQSCKPIVSIYQSQSHSTSNWVFARPSNLFTQNPRFLSQASQTDQTGYDVVSSEKEQASLSFDPNEDAHLVHCDNEDEKIKNLHEFVENDSIAVNGSVDADRNNESESESLCFDDENVESDVPEVASEKLESVLSLLQSSPDGSFESSLNGMDLRLDEVFLVKVVETPLVLGENLVRFFKWAIKKPKFEATMAVVDRLVRAVAIDAQLRNLYAVWDLIKEIGEKDSGVLNVDIINNLIAPLAKLGKGKAAFEVFNKCEDLRVVPNAETYYLTIEALCRRKIFEWGWSVCQKMLDSGILPDDEKVGKIIVWLCKGDKAKEAQLVFKFAKEKQKNPPESSVNFLIGLLCQKDESVKLALGMLDEFSGEGRERAIKPFSTVIRALCRIKEVNEAANLVSKMINEGPPPGNAVFNSVINGYSKAGDLNKAVEMIKLVRSQGLKPDVYTYTVVMSSYANAGQMEEACKLLSEAKKVHSKLSPATYHTLIRGYCKLEEFDKALKLLTEMKDFGVQANTDEYSKLIQSLCLKALDWRTAETLFEEMKEKGLHLNTITQALVRAVKELEEEVGNVEEKITP